MHLKHIIPPLSSGIGYRAPHREAMHELRPAVGFLEVHAENFMGGGRRRADLLVLRHDWPISVHGVGLSLGSAERPDEDHLSRLASLVADLDPILVSEHLSFSRVGNEHFNDLLPLPMTPLMLRVICRNVDIVQQRLGRRILIENPSRYLSYTCSTLSEPEFLNELVQHTGCGVLLDLNNVYVTCENVGGDAFAWCDSLNMKSVGEIHLAGHTRVDAGGETLLIDDHGSTVAEPVWQLFDHVIRERPMAPVLVEWDSRIPELPALVAEARKADKRRARMLADRPPIAAGGGHLAYVS